MASTISGRWAPGRCQAPCRQRMAVCRAFGVAPGAAAWPATPPGPRFLPGNLAAGPSGWQHRPLTPWSWTASNGDVAGACSRCGRSMLPSPADRPAQCQSSPLPVLTGRQESSAFVRCLVGCEPSGTFAAPPRWRQSQKLQRQQLAGAAAAAVGRLQQALWQQQAGCRTRRNPGNVPSPGRPAREGSRGSALPGSRCSCSSGRQQQQPRDAAAAAAACSRCSIQ